MPRRCFSVHRRAACMLRVSKVAHEAPKAGLSGAIGRAATMGGSIPTRGTTLVPRGGLDAGRYACTLIAGQGESAAVITNAKQGDDEPMGARSRNGVWVRLLTERWQHISEGHPELAHLRAAVLTAVENGGAGTVSRRSKMAAHNRAVLCEGTIGATGPITPPFRERHRSAQRHGDLERDTT